MCMAWQLQLADAAIVGWGYFVKLSSHMIATGQKSDWEP